jgi:hypothetical protein
VLRGRVFVVLSLAVIPVLMPRFAAAQAPLQPVAKLEMPASVQGKFDHLGIDEKGSVALTEVVYGERQVEGAQQMSVFKRRRFPVEIILVCVRWYCKYGITYRDLAEMMQERGVDVDASTIFRWGSALRA